VPSQNSQTCGTGFSTFPSRQRGSIALQALHVDKELSNLVRKTFYVAAPDGEEHGEQSILRAEYRATTNRMLRVAVNSFMDSLSLVIQVMQELDVDVLEEKQKG
jgi:EKC/KEOPS complex subunit PCC1/LAGE3